MPKAWTYDLWMTQTTVPGTFSGTKKRGALLNTLDTKLRAYDQAKKTGSEPQKIQALSDLFDASDAWKDSKTDVTKSIRNRGGNFVDFSQWLVDENERLMPDAEPQWGKGTANCYAYAMKCNNAFLGAGPVPGRHAGHAIEPQGYTTKELMEEVATIDREWRLARLDAPDTPEPSKLRDRIADVATSKFRYHAALFEGIVADGEADHGRGAVEVLTDLDQLRAGIYPSPTPIPVSRATGTKYIAAMMVNEGGFHFMRRDSTTGMWSHKNGGVGNGVDTSVHERRKGVNRFLVPIDDTVAAEMLRNVPVHFQDFGLRYKFAGYVLVRTAGITVE